MNTSELSGGSADALLVSNDAITIEQLMESMRQFDMSPKVCGEVTTALVLVNHRKFEAVIIDLQMGGEANAILERVRRSPSNRTAVIFTLCDSDAETASAFKTGANFVLRRPLSLTSISRSLKVACSLMLRERRRYFRCRVRIPVSISRPGIPDVRGETVNISESGIAISSPVSFGTGVKVQVRFALPRRKVRFVVRATICWSKESYLGLQFSSLPPYLTSILQEWLSQRLEETLPESLANKFRKT